MQYYRETGNYLERTSEWVERMGLEHIRSVVVDNVEERKALMERIEFALHRWKNHGKKRFLMRKVKAKCSIALKLLLAHKPN